MKTIGTQVVMPLNVAKTIDENDPVFKMAEIFKRIGLSEASRDVSEALAKHLAGDNVFDRCLR